MRTLHLGVVFTVECLQSVHMAWQTSRSSPIGDMRREAILPGLLLLSGQVQAANLCLSSMPGRYLLVSSFGNKTSQSHVHRPSISPGAKKGHKSTYITCSLCGSRLVYIVTLSLACLMKSTPTPIPVCMARLYRNLDESSTCTTAYQKSMSGKCSRQHSTAILRRVWVHPTSQQSLPARKYLPSPTPE